MVAEGQDRGAPVRAAAARVVAGVLQGQSLNDVLARHQQKVADVDRALLAELAYGVCRWYFRLDFIAGQLLSRPLKARDGELRALILVGLYQLLFSRVAAHAAIGETAGAATLLGRKWATGLVNAVLRRCQREGEKLQAAVDQVPVARYSQQQWFIDAMQSAWPLEAGAILDGLLERPPFTLRVDLRRTSLSAYAKRLARRGLTARPVKGVPSALILDKPVPVAGLPGFAEGLVSVQDAGAQLAAGFLDLRPGMRVLDACAAPGGKTGHLLEQADDLDLTAMDVDRQRLQKVRENLQRLDGSARLVVGDAARPEGDWARSGYDRILADVPCTATGVMRRHPDIRILRRAEDVQQLVGRQREILLALWRLLRPGGKLLYATCSLLPEENEEQIAAFLGTRDDARAISLSCARGVVSDHGLQLLPVDRETDGFYYALLEKENA